MQRGADKCLDWIIGLGVMTTHTDGLGHHAMGRGGRVEKESLKEASFETREESKMKRWFGICLIAGMFLVPGIARAGENWFEWQQDSSGPKGGPLKFHTEWSRQRGFTSLNECTDDVIKEQTRLYNLPMKPTDIRKVLTTEGIIFEFMGKDGKPRWVVRRFKCLSNSEKPEDNE